tara:strand:- start:406 stop:786 length:381 start_codon:yes stop_codon:yes gene_type:complete
MKQKTYTISIALNGNLHHVVQRTGCTVAEVDFLRRTHGQAAVFDIMESGTIDTDSHEERDRLGRMFTDIKVYEVYGDIADLPSDITKLKISPDLIKEPPKKSGRPAKKKAAPVERNIADTEPEEAK